MTPIRSVESRNIYTDLMRKFRDEGHGVTIVSPMERKYGLPTSISELDGVQLLCVKTLNLIKTNFIEKGVGQILVESQFKRAIRKYASNVKSDLILYSTPPITLMGVVKHLKRKNPSALSYLLLKDIFPQNAVDIGIMTKSGAKGVLYKYFRRKEKELYRVSDFIGCMSPANVDYVLKHNPEIDAERVEVAPNSVELKQQEITDDKELELKAKTERHFIRSKYNLPTDKPVFIYGGNLGKPQGIPFLIECLNANASRQDCFFVVVGSGTELPRSRLLSYLEYKMPVVCATDPNTDIGRIAEQNAFGYWCESNSVGAFTNCIDKMLHSDIKAMGKNGYRFMCDNYRIENTYDTIMKHI